MGVAWSGAIGPSQAQLYIGESATSNPYFLASPAIGTAAVGTDIYGHYVVNILSMSAGGQAWENPGTAMLDTGTTALTVPPNMFEALCLEKNQLSQTSCETLQDEVLTIQLLGRDRNFSLNFNLSVLNGPEWVVSYEPLFNASGPSSLNSGPGIILGFPLWFFYYTAMDLSMDPSMGSMGSVTFVENQASVTTSTTSSPPYSYDVSPCEALTQPTKCPAAVEGINTSRDCVYNPACMSPGGPAGCWGATGCQYYSP